MALPLPGERPRRLGIHHERVILQQSLEERGQGAFDNPCPGAGETPRQGLEEGAGFRLGPREGGAAAEDEPGRGLALLLRIAKRLAGKHAAEEGAIAHRAGEKAHRIEALGERLHPGAADPAITRLVAHHAAIGGGTDHAARGLGAQRQGKAAQRHPRRRARARPARGMSRVPGVGGGAGMTVGEFGGHRLADHDRPRGAGERHGGGIGAGPVSRPDR